MERQGENDSSTLYESKCCGEEVVGGESEPGVIGRKELDKDVHRCPSCCSQYMQRR